GEEQQNPQTGENDDGDAHWAVWGSARGDGGDTPGQRALECSRLREARPAATGPGTLHYRAGARPAGGLLGSVAARATFDSMTILDGRQRPHAGERSQALLKANHQGMLFAGAIIDAVLHAAKRESLGEAALPIESPSAPARTPSGCDALDTRLLPPS